jgi:ligand-binding sensor domain-containing protein
VVQAPGGGYLALHRGSDDRKIALSHVDGETWTPIEGITLTTPGLRPEISFARFAPSGILWVGLRYRDGLEIRPWGVALIDVAMGAVAYHHASADRRELAQGVLPVPIGSVDAAFLPDDEVWLATSEGAARLIGSKVTLYDESTGLESELLRAVAVTRGGMVFVASRAGIGTFDGEHWAFPRELGFPVNDLAVAPDGRLWMGTERGIALFDGRRVRRVDVRRGLLENQILDVVIDELGRVWARGPQSVTLISP